MPPKGMSAAAIQKLVGDKVVADRTTRENVDGSRGNVDESGGQGAIKLCRWFEKTESTFKISSCAERNKKPWTEVKKMMTKEFCLDEEIQRMGNELPNLKLRDTNTVSYTQRFNELLLLCPDVVPNKKKKVKAYIKGLSKNIKEETTFSKPVVLNDTVQMAHTLMEQKVQAKPSATLSTLACTFCSIK
nr:hypothetical protein [Tanacetum cinerariifolium]